eukprot:10126892-Ditylum_brightwellii.AAC.1
MTGWCGSVDYDEDSSPARLTNRLSTGGSRNTWATSKVEMDDDRKYIAAAIRDGLAIAVSDGSYKDSRSAAACIIEGFIPNKHPITATAMTPGSPENQDAYQAELLGILMIVIIVSNLCKQYNIQKGLITVACDGLEVIRKAMADDTTFSCQSNQFDLILAIDSMIDESPL